MFQNRNKMFSWSLGWFLSVLRCMMGRFWWEKNLFEWEYPKKVISKNEYKWDFRVFCKNGSYLEINYYWSMLSQRYRFFKVCNFEIYVKSCDFFYVQDNKVMKFFQHLLFSLNGRPQDNSDLKNCFCLFLVLKNEKIPGVLAFTIFFPVKICPPYWGAAYFWRGSGFGTGKL
jgi:hypothetical protein